MQNTKVRCESCGKNLVCASSAVHLVTSAFSTFHVLYGGFEGLLTVLVLCDTASFSSNPDDKETGLERIRGLEEEDTLNTQIHSAPYTLLNFYRLFAASIQTVVIA